MVWLFPPLTSAIKCRMAFPIDCSTPMKKVVVAVPQVLKVFSRVFSWEPTIWTLMSGGDKEVKKTIDILTYKQWLLSIDMKTKVVQHVPKIIFNVFKVFRFSSFQKHSWFPAFVWRSDIFIYKFYKKIVFGSLTLSISPWVSLDMLNNFHSLTLSISHSVSLDMLNNFSISKMSWPIWPWVYMTRFQRTWTLILKVLDEYNF